MFFTVVVNSLSNVDMVIALMFSNSIDMQLAYPIATTGEKSCNYLVIFSGFLTISLSLWVDLVNFVLE